MPRNPSRPLLFCEWAAGATIPSVLGPLPKKKPRRRGVVKVEVTTDDESEEDSLKITYPRSSPSARNTESVVKKVRFEEVPPKSALKKTLIIATESEASSDPSPEVTSEEPSSESAVDASSDSPKSPELPKLKKSKKSKKKPAETPSSEDSSDASSSKDTPSASSADSDSEPHPTCECADCVRGRAKAKKASYQGSKKIKKTKCDKHSDTSEADDEASESAQESEEEIVIVKKNKKKSKAKPEPAKKKPAKEEESSKDETNEPGPSQADKKANAEKAEEKTKPKKKDEKAPLHPEAFPLPHPRRPHLIEPIRAEVVQTERVVETPEDPPPNAFYDPEHNIIRVYYGPVYGNSHGRSLYPRRDQSNRPLPIGMPHPSQNPYYHGFNSANGQPMHTSAGHDPVTQGVPAAPWAAAYPPQWYPAPYPGGPVQGGLPENVDPNKGTTKGVFSIPDRNAAHSSSSRKDPNGSNNVGPSSLKSLQDNPYIPERSKSQFSNFGSNRSAYAASQGGKANSWRQGNRSNNGNDGADGSRPQNSNEWDNAQQDPNAWNNPNSPQDQWGAQNNTYQDQGDFNQQPQQDAWTDGNNAQTDAWQATGADNSNGNQWSSNENQNNGDANTWENNQTQNTDNNGSQEDTWNQNNAGVADNVAPPMPGAWHEAAPVPAWGDPTMAADTHGKIDAW